MRAAAIGIVEHVGVASAHRLGGKVFEHSHDRDQRREMDRDRAAPARASRRRREEARRGVHALLDDRREGAAQQRHLHLVGDAVELVADDFERDRIEVTRGVCHVRPCQGCFRVSMRLPARSDTAVQPARSAVVVSACSTMAGPVMTCPAQIGAIADRASTARDMPRNSACGGVRFWRRRPPARPGRRRRIGAAGGHRWMLRRLTMCAGFAGRVAIDPLMRCEEVAIEPRQ